MPEDLTLRVGLFFKQVAGDTAEFTVRLVKSTAVAGNQYLSNAVGKIPGLAAQSYFTLKDVIENLPTVVEQGAQYAYADGSAFWQAPDDYLLDFAEAATNFSREVYEGASSFDWEDSLLRLLDALYNTGALSNVPDSLPDYEKHQEPIGVYFIPAKAQLIQDWSVVANRYVSAGHSSAFVEWGHAYAGEELEYNHIWVDWNQESYFIPYPFVHQSEFPALIEHWHNPANGYVLEQNNYSGGYDVEAEIFTSPTKPFIFYPERPPCNVPNPFVPFFLVLLPLLLGSFSIGASPWVFGAFVINGKTFTINSKGFKARKE
jgi:hypothetical protein